MRVSTNMLFSSNITALNDKSSSLLRTQQQLSSGKRIISPSDDPVAAAQVLEVSQSASVNTQFQAAQGSAKDTLGLIDNKLSSVNDMLARIRELAVQGGSASLSGSDRKSVTTELRARFDELVAIANSTDGSGQYLFSGYQGASKPFAGSVETGVSYFGDDGQRAVRVSGSRLMPVSAAGSDVFMSSKNGNGVFVTATQTQHSANIAGASIDAGAVTDSVKWAASTTPATQVNVSFWTDTANALGGGANKVYYDLVDATTGLSLFTGLAPATGLGGSYTHGYTSGSAIPLDDSVPGPATFDYGAKVVVSGTPDSGDTFAIKSSNSPLGNGYFTTSPLTGTASINAGTVTSPVKWTSSNTPSQIKVSFWVDSANALGGGGNKVYYDLIDASTNNSLFTGAPSDTVTGTGMKAYTSGAAIPLDDSVPGPATFDLGASVTISGAPSDGDTFVLTGSNSSAGNGYFTTSPLMTAASNAGSGLISAGTVSDPAKWNSSANSGQLEVRFWKNASTSTLYYDLVDATTGKSLFTDTPSIPGSGGTYTHAYNSGNAISFNGLAPAYSDFGASVTISGTPASGDAFTVNRSTASGIFAMLGSMINAIESSNTTGAAGNTDLHNKLGSALAELSQVEDNILRVRADVGSRLNELDDLGTASQGLDIQYQARISELQDVDYSKAISDLTRSQAQLQATQQSFVKIAGMSLFNYL